MFHWYLLLKLNVADTGSGFNDRLIVDCQPDLFSQVSRKTYIKLFFLGLIEFTPIALGIFATEYLQKILFSYDFVLLGILLSIVLVRLLDKKAPQLPFSLRHKPTPD